MTEELKNRIETTMQNLRLNKLEPYFVQTRAEACEKVSELLEKGCRVIGIVTDAEEEGTTEKAREILAENGVTYLNLVPFEGMEELLPLNSWPTSYFVDENGVLIGEPVTAANLKAYRGMIDSLLEQ